MGFLKKLLKVLLVLIVVLIGVAFFLPKSVHVERSITIGRPASVVFAIINNQHRFNAWSPWFDIDPQASYSYSGPERGVGAKFSWVGNKDIGKGSQEIIESKPDQSVKVALDFGDMSKSDSTLSLAGAPQGTKVTWAFDSDLPLGLDSKIVWNVMGRYLMLFMDKMIGPDYEKGLAKLKTLAESLPATDISGIEGEVVQLAPRKIYFITASSGTDPESAKAVLTEAYGKLGTFLHDKGLTMQGAPLTITTSYDKTGWKFDAGVPVERNDAATSGDIQAGNTYAGRAVAFMHVGPYDKIGDTVTKAYAWLAVQGDKATDRLIEDYISDPGNTPVEKLQTRLTIPIE